MNRLMLGLAFAAAFVTSVGAKEHTVLVADASNGRGQSIASVDFVSEGGVSAIQMRLNLPVGVKRVDTSRCLSDLPKGFVGECKAFKNKIAVFVYSPENKTLPAGSVSVGTVSYRTDGLAKAAVTVDKLVAGSPSGEKQKIAAQVEAVN